MINMNVHGVDMKKIKQMSGAFSEIYQSKTYDKTQYYLAVTLEINGIKITMYSEHYDTKLENLVGEPIINGWES